MVASLALLQRNRANNLGRALFLARRQRPEQVYSVPAIQEQRELAAPHFSLVGRRLNR